MAWWTVDDVIERVKTDIRIAEARKTDNAYLCKQKPMADLKNEFNLEISKVLISLDKDKIRHAFLFEACDIRFKWEEVRKICCAVASKGRTTRLRELTSTELEECRALAKKKIEELVKEFEEKIA